MNNEIYYAKSPQSDGHQETVKEHTQMVMIFAEKYGDEIGLSKQCVLAAIFHDFGKYSKSFQQVLLHQKTKVDHAFSGGSFLYAQKANKIEKYQPIIESIAGHHDGLYYVPKLFVDESWRSDTPVTTVSGKSASLSGSVEYLEAFESLKCDFGDSFLGFFSFPSQKFDKSSSYIYQLQSMLFTRIIFSCLVDSDYSASAHSEVNSEIEEKNTEILKKASTSIYNYVEKLHSSHNGNLPINNIRDYVYGCCSKTGADSPTGIFTLTAPTGTGKTLALFNFALKHCLSTGKKRIIIVLPFLTLIQQNAAIYEEICDDIFVDTSQSEVTDDRRILSEKWTSSVIITTSVRFFECLFSNKPTECRKIHNIANSVVVFDESQSLPCQLTSVTLDAIKELSNRYNVSFVFSTATQPNYNALPGCKIDTREIIDNPNQLYSLLTRVQTIWKIFDKDKNIIYTPLSQIAAEVSSLNNVCVILNIRSHARKLFKMISNVDKDSVFFLSADICNAHALNVIECIKQRQRENKPCRVISTQSIEAGVDLDFDCIYRALAPLESIVQAAGRCNRNGKHSRGQIVVFIPDEKKPLYPERWYEVAANTVLSMLSESDIDINNPNDLNAYYTRLFSNKDTSEKEKNLISAIENRDYPTVHDMYKLVSSETYTCFVPYNENLSQFENLKQKVMEKGLTKKDIHENASITVSVYKSNREKLEKIAEPAYLSKRGIPSEIKSGYYFLLPQCYDNYDSEKLGLMLDNKNETYLI